MAHSRSEKQTGGKLMFGGLQAFVPDSADDPEADEFQVVYASDEGRERHLEDAPAGRAARLRYSAAYAGGTLASQRAGGSSAAAGVLQHPAGSPAASGGHGAAADPGSPVLSAPQQQEPQLTLAQQIQTVLHGMTQQPQAGVAQAPPAAQRQQQQAQVQQHAASMQQPPQRQRRHSGQIKHSSPAVPPQAMLPAGGGPPSGGGQRRWRQAQAAAAAQREQQSPAVPPDGGGSTFFAVDDDLVQAAQRQAAQQQQRQQQQQAGRRRQPRTVQWDSPQAPTAAPFASQQPGGAEQTPVQSQRPNPLATLLHGGSGGGSASRPRPATTGSKPRGRHPIYGQAPATAAAAPTALRASAREGSNAGGATGSSSRQLREALGLRDPPLTSPRQVQQARRQPPHQHSRFAIREPVQVAAEEAAASQQAAGGAAGAVPAAAGLRLLTGAAPASAEKEQFQPRPRRAPTSSDRIVDDEEDSTNGRQQGQPAAQQQQQQQQQQGGAAVQDAAAADAFRTPGQHLRSGRPAGSAAEAAAAAVAAAAEAAPDSNGRPDAPGSSGGKGALSLQRQFIAQLQPVSRPAAAATMQQQRQRLAGAAGLHARMQAILVAEKAGLDAQSPAGGAAAVAAPRLTVLQKELEGSITKCLCRCDGAAQAALGAPEVVALLQKATAREVDTAPGCTLLLRQPWRIIHLPGSQWPVVLCYAAGMG
ncbi:hypothetical protein C2E21_2458 [Chlorella sorokiniana]|uniref:Uncharacterized protein n=1 Tax=Chlorella sorokiniana TaxID=3076 RepID=A0A2P6TXU4_CHLSO|nr:hypothetical protein C2E21_2458 [Chlorella sorokiniana]|eukprot:PRW58887.1 hypothetical protein C2E21_2458 [Chlorella sorokiniana]